MRKILFFLIFSLFFAAQSFGDHTKYPKPDLTIIKGCQECFYLYGGQYRKGDIVGIVYYISPDRKCMKIIPQSTRIIPGRGKSTLSFEESIKVCQKNGFDLPTFDEMVMIIKHQPLMRWNILYDLGWDIKRENNELWTFPNKDKYYWTKDFLTNDKHIILYGLDVDNKNLWATNYNEISTDGLNYLGVVGTKEVPFEPQYISGTYSDIGF